MLFIQNFTSNFTFHTSKVTIITFNFYNNISFERFFITLNYFWFAYLYDHPDKYIYLTIKLINDDLNSKAVCHNKSFSTNDFDNFIEYFRAYFTYNKTHFFVSKISFTFYFQEIDKNKNKNINKNINRKSTNNYLALLLLFSLIFTNLIILLLISSPSFDIIDDYLNTIDFIDNTQSDDKKLAFDRNKNFIRSYNNICYSKKLEYNTDYLYNTAKNLKHDSFKNGYVYTYNNTLTSKFIDYHNLLENKHKKELDKFHNLVLNEIDLIQKNKII